ncbi:MAG: hypothetical protein ACI37T_07415 [Candidatus Gastranaerophilaceae bacterium]
MDDRFVELLNSANLSNLTNKYLEFPVTNSTEKKYLKVQDLYNVYQQGSGIIFDGKTIKIDTTVVATKTDLTAKVNAADTYTKDEMNDFLYEMISGAAITPLS